MSLRLDRYKHTDARGDRSTVLPSVNLSRLARDVGINRGHMSLVINGRIVAGRELLFKLAKALDGSVEEVDRWLHRLKAKNDRRRAS